MIYARLPYRTEIRRKGFCLPKAAGELFRINSARIFSTASSKSNAASSAIQPAPASPLPPTTLPEKFVAALPVAMKPYAELSRLDKPIGTWLLYSPGTWSITMAAYSTGAPLTQTIATLGLFGIGSLAMRGAGCTINDIWDRDLDDKVERTKTRPLAAKAVSLPKAVTWLGAQCFAGLGVLVCLPADCFWICTASLPFIFTYPLFKRFTYYPQVSLSFCFTWAALAGFPAMGVWNWPAMLALHASSFAWCMIYDTIYAHQDKKFDIKAGIKSTALKWGERTKPILQKFAVAQIGLLGLSGFFVGMGPFFYGATALAGYRVFSMIKKVDLDCPKNCWYWFRKNINTGHLVWLGATLDYLSKLFL